MDVSEVVFVRQESADLVGVSEFTPGVVVLVRRSQFFLYVIFVLQIFDVWTTKLGLDSGAEEANVLMRPFVSSVWVMLGVKAVAAVAAWFVFRSLMNTILIRGLSIWYGRVLCGLLLCLIFLYVFVIANNLSIVFFGWSPVGWLLALL